MEFKLPDVGEGIAEGEVVKWFVKEGDAVKEDEPLVEVMTDKVNVQIPSPRTGRVSRLMAREGDIVKVGQTLLIIDVEGEAPEANSPPVKGSQVLQVSVKPPEEARAKGEGAAPPTVLATPATRRLARELGVDLAGVKGTGQMGRITEENVRAASQGL